MKCKCSYCHFVKKCKLYPYNSFDSLGWLCYSCYRKIDFELSSFSLSPICRDDFWD